MAAVTSLGLHQPVGLQYAIQEGLLLPDPCPSSYTWHNICDRDGECEVDDELLVTTRCVLWSRGGVFRKSFKFDLEKEAVSHALITSFPSVDPIPLKIHKAAGKTPSSSKRSKAIVVLLKTQAHVFFLSGTSHVIHLPFEFESATAVPNGLILQRKLRVDTFVPASLKFPRVPPNSFVSSQPPPFSGTSSVQSTFSIADLGAPKQMQLPHITTLQDLAGKAWEAPVMKDDSNWPRLFSLSDPLAEMGLVVAHPRKHDGHGRGKRPVNFAALDPAEEVLHVSHRSDFLNKTSDPKLVLALTLNKETSMYNVWVMSYAGQDTDKSTKHRIPSGTQSRRRSSFIPGGGTGATTPVGKSTFRESLGGAPLAVKKTCDAEEPTQAADFASTLDPDYDKNGTPQKKKKHRVSSVLVRSDLSASHERSAYSDNNQHGKRRGDSLGSLYARTSIGPNTPHSQGYPQPPFAHTVTSFSDAPVDDLLDGLRNGGDFEGFDNMGLEDAEFDALEQEIMLSHVCQVAAEHDNVRFSRQHLPAQSQCKVLILAAPHCATDERKGRAIVYAILDAEEEKLTVIKLYAKNHRKAHLDDHGRAKGQKNITIVRLADDCLNPARAPNVIDACRVDDGNVSRILVLGLSEDGREEELSLQAPWSERLRLPLPDMFAVHNLATLAHSRGLSTSREEGRRRLSRPSRSISALCNPQPNGLVDLVDGSGNKQQLQIQMQPRNPHVCKIIDVCMAVLTGERGGGNVLVSWWRVMQWLRQACVCTVDQEWTAIVVVLFAMVIGDSSTRKRVQKKPLDGQRKSRSANMRSGSGEHLDLESWHTLHAKTAPFGNTVPFWASSGGWKWTTEQDAVENLTPTELGTPSSHNGEADTFIQKHVKLARDFTGSPLGQETISKCLLTFSNDAPDARHAALVDTFSALHLLREEQRLDTMASDALDCGIVSLTPVLAQIYRWLGWKSWVESYDTEDAALGSAAYDLVEYSTPTGRVNEPFECPSVYGWLQNSFLARKLVPFITLQDLVAARFPSLNRNPWDTDQWRTLTPRVMQFTQFLTAMQKDWSPAQFVEALALAGVDGLFLETLPEAILAPLQEAIVQCQREPPTTWDKDLLALVAREDVNILLTPGERPSRGSSSPLAPLHQTNLDVHTICMSTLGSDTIGSLDSSADTERQVIARAIFKDDRRMNEAIQILNVNKPTIAQVKSSPEWNESELLEAQKEHAQMLAYRTLAIPSGRGLLDYGARIPLLTQKIVPPGFNLNCVMKPNNNTVGIDKAAFTEEKICWAFFNAGVSAGLSISREARGIDTSWILFNKPPQEFNNRHAGFLLALGLNGHLKSVAKWVAFKYLTPKHTMTSIGLLLGLAASYIGTMDSLVTRLLSVHVTRMLPPGAAELNLSPLTQTAGVMGIGLLYCNTQHRRMSEVMLSEIEHIDTETEEEPLRNEGYRLAAGFALGFINLGKGSDLKGLHDMRLTERLITLAAGSKKVDLVHVLDKATAASVVAIALIYMKSGNRVLARKIDVPESILQFNYVRPDIFLLRTLAKHLILWSMIEPSFAWVKRNLPKPYRERSSMEGIHTLTTTDLPFYDILAGLCFSIALRYAGSGSIEVRDLLLHYLDQFMRICRIGAASFDKKLTRNTVRTCQDLLALSAAIVMAGTGDISTFRRLRSLHGRDDGDTPYGSHLATHLAMGALFLGGGTFTFGTSNKAIAALLVAFYPIFPSSVQDNKSHLQAFRHFWVLGAEPRCLVTRDIDTNQTIPIPLTITLRNDQVIERHTPSLIPELDQIKTVRTCSSEYWNVILDMESNPTHVAAFKATQTLHMRKRPAHDASINAFKATLHALHDAGSSEISSQSLAWIYDLPAFATLTKAERALMLGPDQGGARDVNKGTEGTMVDARLVLQHATLDGGNKDRLLGARFLFKWAEAMVSEGREMRWIRKEVVEGLKARVWMRGMAEEKERRK